MGNTIAPTQIIPHKPQYKHVGIQAQEAAIHVKTASPKATIHTIIELSARLKKLCGLRYEGIFYLFYIYDAYCFKNRLASVYGVQHYLRLADIGTTRINIRAGLQTLLSKGLIYEAYPPKKTNVKYYAPTDLAISVIREYCQ